MQNGPTGRGHRSLPQGHRAQPDFACAHTNLGICSRRQGKLDEAIACYRKAIELDPKYACAHNNLGNALSDQGKLDEAIACYRKAIELDPKYASAHYNLGNALDDQGKLDEAIACYRKAIELDPKYADAHNNLGNALHEQGKLDEAIACLPQGHRTRPEIRQGPLQPRHRPAATRGSWTRPSPAYRKAIELDPKYAEAHNNLGIALTSQRKLDEAIACYRKAIELDPKFAVRPQQPRHRPAEAREAGRGHRLLPQGHRTRPEIRLGLTTTWPGYLATCPEAKFRDPKQAVELAKKAVELDPQGGNYWNTLGTAHYRAGDGKPRSPPWRSRWNSARAATASTGSSWPWPTGNWAKRRSPQVVRPGRRVDGEEQTQG